MRRRRKKDDRGKCRRDELRDKEDIKEILKFTKGEKEKMKGESNEEKRGRRD